MEQWRAIADFPTYEVSNLGRVRRIAGGRWGKPGGILKNGDRGKGYLRVMLRHDGRSKTVFVHHLVAEAFLGPRPSPIHEAAHMDGNRGNNVLSNIQWVTRKENHHHKQIHGTVARGERQGASKLKSSQVMEIRAAPKDPKILRTMAAKFGVDIATIHCIRRYQSWRHLA